MDLRWDARSGATSYVVSAALQEQPIEWVPLGEAPVTAVHVFGIPSDTTVYFVVQASTALGPGRYSPPVAATTAIESVAVKGIGNSLVVSWTTVQIDPHFDVFRASSAAGPFAQVASRVQSPWADQNLADGTTRFYRVRPSAGGADSNVASSTTRPPPPSGLTATSDFTGDVLFSWQPAAGALHYLLTGTTRTLSTFGAGVDGTSASVAVSPRSGPSRYQASIVALNDAGRSEPSEIVGGLTAPSLREFFPGPGRTHLTFEGGGEGSIVISRGPSASGPWTPVATHVIAGDAFEIVDPDAPGWTTVWYRAQGVDPLGPGDSTFLSMDTFGAPDISLPALFSGSGCERSVDFDTVAPAEQGFTPTATGTLMGLQASVSVQFGGATVEAHILDAAGNDLGHATVPSSGSCPQPLTESVSILYSDFSQSGIHVVAGTPMRLQLRVVGPFGAFAAAGIAPDGYPGEFTSPHDIVPAGQDLILRTFVKAGP